MLKFMKAVVGRVRDPLYRVIDSITLNKPYEKEKSEVYDWYYQTEAEILTCYKEHNDKYYKLYSQLVEIDLQLKRRDQTLLIYKVRQNIEDLETMFLPHTWAKKSPTEKWIAILSNNSPYFMDRISLSVFRDKVASLDTHDFIDVVNRLHSEFSYCPRICFPVFSDTASIRNMLYSEKISCNQLNVSIVEALLTPIEYHSTDKIPNKSD